MRILIVSQMFWPETFRINDLAAEFVTRGHEVTVLTAEPNYPEGRLFPEYKKNPQLYADYKGIRIVRAPIVTRGRGRLRLLLNYISFVISGSIVGAWKLRNDSFDVIFVHESSPVTVGLPAIVLRRLKQAPLAFWVLDLWPDTLEAIGIVRSRFLISQVGRLVAFIYARCDLILAQSRSFIPQIEKYCRGAPRIEYFPSWAEVLFGATDTICLAPEVTTDTSKFNILFAGNIGEAQDFPAILDAAELLKSDRAVRWLILGDGRMGEWVRNRIHERGLSDSVLMLGRYPVERMPSFYAHADALLVSLKDESIFAMTIPGKLQSYLAAGIPVIAMLNGEGASVVKRAKAGLTCRAADSAGLAEAVRRLKDMPLASRQELGRNGLELSKCEFDREKLFNKLESWLDALCAAAKVGGLKIHR